MGQPIRGAGAYVRRLDGLPYRVTDRDSGLLVATDEGSWRTLRATRSGISEDAVQPFGGGSRFRWYCPSGSRSLDLD